MKTIIFLRHKFQLICGYTDPNLGYPFDFFLIAKVFSFLPFNPRTTIESVAMTNVGKEVA